QPHKFFFSEARAQGEPGHAPGLSSAEKLVSARPLAKPAVPYSRILSWTTYPPRTRVVPNQGRRCSPVFAIGTVTFVMIVCDRSMPVNEKSDSVPNTICSNCQLLPYRMPPSQPFGSAAMTVGKAAPPKVPV